MKRKVIIKDNEVVFFTNKKDALLVKKAIEENLLFFGEIKMNFVVIFLEKREELNQIEGTKTPEWVVGGNYGDENIYLFAYEVFDKVSLHSKKDFFPTLVHEIAHIYSNNGFYFHLPQWLNEGISVVVARQDLNATNLIDFKSVLKSYSEEDWQVYHPYTESGLFVNYLIKKFGKDNLFDLLRLLDSLESRETFEEKFNQVYENSVQKIFEEFLKSEMKD